MNRVTFPAASSIRNMSTGPKTSSGSAHSASNTSAAALTQPPAPRTWHPTGRPAAFTHIARAAPPAAMSRGEHRRRPRATGRHLSFRGIARPGRLAQPNGVLVKPCDVSDGGHDQVRWISTSLLRVASSISPLTLLAVDCRRKSRDSSAVPARRGRVRPDRVRRGAEARSRRRASPARRARR